jgi:group II intron reverse transcriptase/maturase
MTNGHGKSDRPIVPKKSPNKAPPGAAEGVEGRGLAKGNPHEQNALRTQGRARAHQALERVRKAARKDRKQRLTALFHHVYDVERLRQAYYGVRHDAAPGIDGQTWRSYGEDLEENLRDLSERLRRGAYRARPVKRAYVPKLDGRQRPIGLPVLEDKIVQRAVAEVLTAVYDREFFGFSYGFRAGRNQHQALGALRQGLCTKKVNWVLDADLRAFFDTLRHEWLGMFVAHRVGDQRIGRLIQKWLRAGVLEDGKRTQSEVGTVQGGSISPLLANIYLHYVFDLWVQQWRTKRAQGDMVVVRFADDFIVGFEHRQEAERFLAELRERLTKFGLELHPEKTRLIEFGRFAAQNRADRGEGKPETFDFLGFTHICGKTKGGRFEVLRQTMRKKWQAKLKEVYQELRRRMHESVAEQGRYLRAVMRGHIEYYGVPGNRPAMNAFRFRLGWLWWKVLRRRSQKDAFPKARLARIVKRWLPYPYLSHPYSLEGLRVRPEARAG